MFTNRFPAKLIDGFENADAAPGFQAQNVLIAEALRQVNLTERRLSMVAAQLTELAAAANAALAEGTQMGWSDETGQYGADFNRAITARQWAYEMLAGAYNAWNDQDGLKRLLKDYPPRQG